MPAIQQLPEYRRLNTEDLKGDNWRGPLTTNMNTFNEGVYNVLNKQLSIGSNVNGMMFSGFAFTTRAAYATGDFVPIKFNYTGAAAPQNCLLGSIDQTEPAAIILAATSLIWSYNNNVAPPQVSINYIAGLLPLTTYVASFILL